MLPPAPPRETIDLDPKDFDKYEGQYESEQDEDILTIFKEKNKLNVHGQDVDKVELFPETESRFFGTAIDIVDFQINFVSNKQGEVEHLTLHFGFRSVRYDRIR